jgi:hypothetical protein
MTFSQHDLTNLIKKTVSSQKSGDFGGIKGQKMSLGAVTQPNYKSQRTKPPLPESAPHRRNHSNLMAPISNLRLQQMSRSRANNIKVQDDNS